MALATADSAAEILSNLNINAGDWPPNLVKNLHLLPADQIELAKMLSEMGQSHLFQHWAEPGVEDDQKKAFFAQVAKLNSSYPGGLASYIQTARELLADSKTGKNPYDGFTPSVPTGEILSFGDDNFINFEEAGVKEAQNAAFVLVAGGLGERLGYNGIKVALPAETTTGTCFLQSYIESILALQEASGMLTRGTCQKEIPFVIMTSDDTHTRTLDLLESNSYFGMKPAQVKLLKQEKVACLDDNDARLALDPHNKYKIQTKPHGHGDVHSLLYSSGLLNLWHDAGLRWVIFFQDTNGLLFKAIPASLGVSATKQYHVNSIAVQRKAKEAIGGITRLTHSDESVATTRFGEVTTSQTTGELQNIQAAYRLNGKNYLKWFQLVQTFLKGKGKLSHLLGTGPEKGDPKFEAWDEEDSMVMSWLWNSMTPDISDTCMFLSTAKDIWESIRQTYSKVKDATQVYEVKIKTAALKQGNKSVTEYAILLKNLWQEMDHYQCIEMKCSEDATTLKKFIEKDRVYDFLAGLNVEFDQVRVQILGKQDLPSLNEVISMVRAEESRRGVMLDSVHVEGSAMVSNGGKNQSLEQLPVSENGKGDSAKTSNRDNLWCTYCKKPRHTRDRCWKLHGKPSTSSKEWGYKGGQPRNQGQAHMTAMELNQEKSQEQGELDKKEIEKLRSLLGTLEKATGVCSLAHSGRSMVINVEYNQLDPLLRATGHPDGDVNCETGYSPFPGNINQLILELGPYIEELTKTGGAIKEFVNPKYKDASKTSFKSSTRLECMMQDYPKTLPPSARVGFTVMDTWLAYAPVKNNSEDAAKVPKGNPYHSATSGEMAIYRANSLILKKAGVQMEDPVQQVFSGQEVEVWPRVTWKPKWGLTFAEIKRKISGSCSISQRSTMALKGHDIFLEDLSLDGALIINSIDGAEVKVGGSIQNKGWLLESIDYKDIAIPEELRIRGFQINKLEQLEETYVEPGKFTLKP
ncbi:UDP-sugar pyrophosphorylase-like isoform X4 [Durio zibethinus]|uniref:UTP-monosaccharide-1-phosphate uridylyltransferase n=1 Tax=Durio zibethinus TaxID=66656 RepID=A0A6P6ATH7_DURZI|nr:UDP-sugar pyrophosphorylase-like isoform X4 [Durio zibethinus]